ncbi:hypothetical protein SNE40_021994 [Patella caerulea]|uniref:C2H2-type domain-containing protein n=1 Tax=Patella caerulea TaxID=87958 RepID=A0AAN8GD36_PATCE
MSGPNKSEYSYDLAESSKATPSALSSPYSRIQEIPNTVAELECSVTQDSYNSELYNYASNEFPRKSRMCSYCSKVFTRSTTRRYHEKRCPLLRAAGSLLNNATTTEDQLKNEADTFSSNTSFPVASVVPYTSCYEAFPSSLYSTQADSDQNRTHVLTDTTTEPRERKDRTDGRDIRNHNLDGPSRCLMSDMENVARPMFSPANNHSPESLPSRGQNSPSSISDEGDSQVDGETLKTSADDIINTSKDHAKYEQMSGLQAVRSVSYSHSGTIYATGTEKDDSPRGGILTSQHQLTTIRKLGELERKMDHVKFSGITQGYKEDNELGEVTPKKNISDKQCGLCGQLFDNIEELEAHEQLHTNYKPYACRFCGERFTKVSIRITHERVHIGEKPYVCALCGLTFTRKYSVRIHMRSKHVDGACSCCYCGETLFDLHSLKDHLLSHDLTKAEKDSLNYLNTNPAEKNDDDRQFNEGSMSSDNNDEKINGLTDAPILETAPNSKDKDWCRLCEKGIPKYFLRYHDKNSTTSLLQYAGYNTTTPLKQSDALNLTVHSPHLNSKIKLLANQMEDNNIQKADAESDEVSRKSDSPTDVKLGCRNMGVQVKSCCQADAKGLRDASYDLRMLSPSSFESSGSVVTRPSLSSGTETVMNETLSSLLSSGKMFRCSHCCSFFAEYAMYRIHQKLHVKDAAHPSMCPQCGEDCQDRIYFSLHLAEHLK